MYLRARLQRYVCFLYNFSPTKKQPTNQSIQVWSILALCCVDAAVIDNYILAILPLASMGAIKKMASTELDDMIRDHGAMWVSQELGPKLLLEAFPQMSFTSEGIAQFRISCSGVIHRITPTWMNNSDALPCVVILTAVLTSTEVPSVQSLLNFAKACKDIGVFFPPFFVKVSPPFLFFFSPLLKSTRIILSAVY